MLRTTSTEYGLWLYTFIQFSKTILHDQSESLTVKGDAIGGVTGALVSEYIAHPLTTNGSWKSGKVNQIHIKNVSVTRKVFE